MPEPNKRVVVKGIKAAAQAFEAYVRARLEAEKAVAQLDRELKRVLAAQQRTRRNP